MESRSIPTVLGSDLPEANGGVNPAAVEHMSQVLGGFGRIVWTPTHDAEAAVRSSSQHDRAFAAVSRNGELLPESQEVDRFAVQFSSSDRRLIEFARVLFRAIAVELRDILPRLHWRPSVERRMRAILLVDVGRG